MSSARTHSLAGIARSISLRAILQLLLLAWCIPSAAEQVPDSGLHLDRGTLSAVEAREGVPVPRTTFRISDTIYFFTQLSWDPTRASGGAHHLLYKWFDGDSLRYSFPGKKSFDFQPVWWAAMAHGGHFQPGHHRAELWIDEQLFDRQEFDVVPDTADTSETSLAPESLLTSAKDEVTRRDALKLYARELLLLGDTEAFEKETAALRASRERTPAGAWRIYYFYHCLDDFTSTQPDDPQWAQLESTTADWLARAPDSPAAALMAANALLQHGWAYRGSGFANTVSPRAGRSYGESVERARMILDTHRAVSDADPEWYALRIDVAKQQGAKPEQIDALIAEALKRYPTYYPIEYAAVEALSPKWGGSEEAIKGFVQQAVERSREQEGTQAYARIYIYIARNARSPVDELNLSGAKREPFKQSMDEVLRAYPDLFNQDTARGIYCFAGFKDDFVALGRHPSADHFPVAWWDTPDWRRGCEAWGFEGRETFTPLSYRMGTWVSFLQGFGKPSWRTVSVIGLLTLGILEFLFSRTVRRRRPPDSPWPGPEEISGTFDPTSYPRSYTIMPSANAIPMRVLVRALVFCLAVAWMLSTIPWKGNEQVGYGFVICLCVASACIVAIYGRFAARIVLRPDALEYRTAFTRRLARRAMIAGWGFLLPHDDPSGGLKLLSRSGIVMNVPPVYGYDEPFSQWLESLPGKRAASPGRARGEGLVEGSHHVESKSDIDW
jgi:hypothetical protein